MQPTLSGNQFKHISVIFNATKKRHDVELYCELVQARMPACHIEVVPTDDLMTGLQQAKVSHERGTDLLVSAGGDGTLLSVVNAILQDDGQSGTPLTILPLGTGNDYAKTLGIHSVADAVAATCDGSVTPVDAGLCTFYDSAGNQQKISFCSTAGVGMFAHIFHLEKYAISRRLKQFLGDGAWPFLAATSIFASHNVTTDVQMDARIDAQLDKQLTIQSICTEMFMFELSKIPNPGGFLLTPNAAIDTGYFDSWIVHNANKMTIWALLLKALANKAAHLRDPHVDYFTNHPEANRFGYSRPTRIVITPREPMKVHLNGDTVGQTPATFEILPKALQVLRL